jgi:hypothetical protein
VSACGNGVIEGDEWCDGESFCQGCTIARHACCEYPAGEALCAIDVPALTLYANQYQVCGFYGGTFRMGMLATGTTSCPNPPVGAPPIYAGGCGLAPSLPEPVSVCCKLPTCVDRVATNETELATFVWNCLYTNYPSFPVVVGACGVGGSCVPAH